MADRILKPQLFDNFTNLVAELGTNKDKKSHGTFGRRELDPTQLEAMYEFDWLSGKVVDIPVDDATRNWRTITAPSVEDRMEEIRQAEEDIGIRSAINDAQKWADLYRGAIIVMIVKGNTPVWEPLDPATVKQGDLQRLEVFDSTEATIRVDNTNDVTEPDFRHPSSYSIAGGQQIHSSRVLHFEGYKLPWRPRTFNNYWGGSRLVRFYDALRNSRSTTDSIASMIYEAKLDIISVPELYQELAGPDGTEAIVNRFALADMIKSFNNTLLLDSKETFNRNNTSFAGLADLKKTYMIETSAAADIPATRLFGQAASGLNATGEGDERNYYDRINSDQETRFRPPLTVFDQVFARSVLGAYPPDWRFEFNPLRQMNETEIAEIRLKNAQRHEIDMRNDVVTPGIVARQYLEDRIYEAIDEEYVNELLALDAEEPASEPAPNPFETDTDDDEGDTDTDTDTEE
jgi:phage-related protein (TIGR01555 family)